VRERIVFHKGSIFDFPIETRAYKGIILMRFIQYVSPEDLPGLLSACAERLESTGLLMMCYTSSGGLPYERLQVQRWEHDISFVKDLLSASNMQMTFSQPGPTVTSCPGPKYPVESHDMIAVKRPDV
jgi:hypothetical protein